jgi:hypothetical protein
MNPVIAPKSKEERDAAFAKLFANVTPSDQQHPSVMQLLEPYREQIVQKRKEGYSLRQITETIKQDPVGIKVSNVTLLKFLGGKNGKRRKAKTPIVLRPIIPLGSLPVTSTSAPQR